ncbi:PQQ-binding-like beta-propeller repeat protein [Cellulomonas soli]|uniref:outer membrane protein assembly factor BamB family protein n=1 Tax=Cellulomonas soli TaxID=931535 RepID=UPI003F870031
MTAKRLSGARMQPVELDEGSMSAGVPVRAAAASPDTHRVAARPVVGRRGRRIGAVGALVVLLLVAGVVGAVQVRDSWRADAIAAVPGLVRPLDGPPQELWRAPVSSVAREAVLVADGALVLLDDDGPVWQLSAYEVGSGAPRWSRRLVPVVTAPETTGTQAVNGVTVRCPSQGADVGPWVVCAITGPDPTVWFGRSRVVIVSAEDGSTAARWTVPGRLLGVSRVQDDVVVVSADRTGLVEVTRLEAPSGEVLWSVPTGDQLISWLGADPVKVEADARFVLVSGAGSAALRARDGVALVPTPPLSAIRLAAAGDHLAAWSIAEGGWWFDASGTPLFPLPALPVEARADDGSVDVVLLVDLGSRLQGLDSRSGAVLWSIDSRRDVALLVDSRAVVTGADGYGVIDPRDGHEVWTVDRDEPLPWIPVSDGGSVLAPGPPGSSSLVALGLGDGIRYWSIELPERVVDVRGVDGHLLVRTPDEVVVMG